MLTIHSSSRFRRSFKQAPSHVKIDFAKRIDVFKEQPFHSSLHTHKLSGNLANYYAFYLCDGWRVLFAFVESNIALLVNIGSHDDYKKWARA